MIVKICSKCGLEKAETEFYKTSGRRCKDCFKKQTSENLKRNPEKNRERAKRWYYARPENRQRSIDSARRWQRENRGRDKFLQHRNSLLRNYNLAYEDYVRMVEEQGGKCRICKQPPNRRLDVDHDHSCCPGNNSCGKCIRGLLCSNCNTAIGLLKESPELFANALSYLS